MANKRHLEIVESRQMDHLRVFHDVARALTQSLELEEILTAIMEKMAAFFGPERWSLLLVDEAANDLYYEIAIGQTKESMTGLRVKMGDGISGWVAQTGQPLIVPNISLDPNWQAFARNHADLNIQSMACVPIRSRDRTLGVIQLLNSKLDLMTEYSISFLRILCDYAAIAIENSRQVNLIQELTITDDCTGLFNARHLYVLLEEQVRTKSRFSLLFMDLDHFKSINDSHGHLIGSRLLAEVGNLIKRSLGPENSAFRYGGDEFVALLPRMDKNAAVQASIKLRDELRRSRFLEGAGLSLTISGSFGLATFPEDGDSVAAILRSADTMMYEAKNSTRDNVAVAGRGLLFEGDRNAGATRISRVNKVRRIDEASVAATGPEEAGLEPAGPEAGEQETP